MSLSFLPFLEAARNAVAREATGSNALHGAILPLHVVASFGSIRALSVGIKGELPC